MKDEPQVQKRFIFHPSYTQPANLKNRIICQLIASVMGRVKMYAHKDNDDCVAFEGTKAEEIQVQYLTDLHVSSFWQRVELLYKEYIEEHNLYCKEDDAENISSLNEANKNCLVIDEKFKILRK